MKQLKYFTWTIICMMSILHVRAQYSGGGEANPDLPTHQEALQRFRDMRFGMFIHWGPVSLRGEEISWSRGREIPIEEYDDLYKEFDPVSFDAAQWVMAAKTAGMKYIIITSRHHDGFSLWDSRYTEYDMASTPYGKGILEELANECRKEGLEFGTYYSICDWYRPDYPVVYPDPDYNFREERTMDAATMKEMENYITFMKNQLRELIEKTNTFVIWFDGEWEWAWTHQMGMDMYAYLRGLKNDILINNRVDKGREGMEDKSRSPRFAGDFATPEQNIGAFDNQYAWETCMTIGKQWAWRPNEQLKSRRECIHTLAHTIGGDGNLLFNVGPMPDGRIEQRQLDRLSEMGEWVSKNQEAVYGTRGGPYLPTDRMVSTRKENNIYLILLENTGGRLNLPLKEGINVQKACFLHNRKPLLLKRDRDKITITLPEELPDKDATVVVLTVDTPASDIEEIEQQHEPYK
ncbi:MAG: alpha-L-fucosidase [Bacteroidales bacterium]|nr:alpha-L-fucosidase [Bacteroidales bacterium]